MRTQRHVAVLSAFLLGFAAAPSWGVEVVFVPPSPHGEVVFGAAAPEACQAAECGWRGPRRSLTHPKSCAPCLRMTHGGRKPLCDPCSLPNAGYHPTHWRYLPSEPEPLRPSSAQTAQTPETLPSPAANNKEPPAKKKATNNDPDDKLPTPRKTAPR
jgi:hypothetical protein